MNISRKLKLSELGIYTIKETEIELFDFIKNNLINLKIKNDNHEIIFMKSNKWHFTYSLSSNELCVESYIIWKMLRLYFRYDIEEAEYLIEDIMKHYYKIKNIAYINSNFINEE